LADRPLHLKRHLSCVAGPRERVDSHRGPAALILGVHGAVLPVAIGRRPGPSGLLSQYGQSIEIRMQPQVTDRAAGEPAIDDRVVE
jgi:hypothetical protein